MKTVITTVGTSIFENFMDEDKNKKSNLIDDCGEDLLVLRNKRFIDYDRYKRRIKNVKEVVSKWISESPKYSAELRSLEAIYEKYKEPIDVMLITSDTILSNIAAELLEEYIKNDTVWISSIKKYRVGGLQVENTEEFEEKGLPNLIELISQFLGENLIFNITGGYKAIVPYLTTVALIYDFPIVYIFEDSEELLSLPSLPIDFDYEIFENDFIAFESIKPEKSEKNLPTSQEFEGLLEFNRMEYLEKTGVLKKIKIDNKEVISLSPIGKLLYSRYQDFYIKGGEGKYFGMRNMLSSYIELKIAQFFFENKKFENCKVMQGRKTDRGYEVDVLVECPKWVDAIEVKPASRVPILEERYGNESLETKITKGGFKELYEKFKDKVKFYVVMYTHTAPEKVLEYYKEDLEKLASKLKDSPIFKQTEWHVLTLPKDYKRDTSWKVDKSKLKKIYP